MRIGPAPRKGKKAASLFARGKNPSGKRENSAGR